MTRKDDVKAIEVTMEEEVWGIEWAKAERNMISRSRTGHDETE